MERAAPRADEERPKVESVAAFESVENDKIKLNSINPRDSGTSSQDTILKWIVCKSAGNALGCACQKHVRQVLSSMSAARQIWTSVLMTPGDWGLGDVYD